MPLLALLFAGLIGLVPWAQAAEGAPQAIPALTAPVMDVADLLPAPEEAHLNSRLLTFSKEKGSQIVILIVPTTQPEDIFSYSFRVAETWKPGRKGVDDGVVLVIAVQDRKTHLQVGYGLEGAIPDARAKQILQDIIRPYFKAGNYPAGIDAGVDAVITLINGEQLPPPTTQSATDQPENPVIVALVIGMMAGLFLRAAMGRLIGGLAGGGIALTFALVLGSAVATAAVVALIVLLFSSLAGNGRRLGGYHGGFGSGGFGGGGGGFGEGGGGFSGGGGGFGGGGASGDW
jgi:uncharacterized protein